jgi:hypothetical protein
MNTMRDTGSTIPTRPQPVTRRLTGLLALGGLAVLVSGCVVAPVGYRAYGGYQAAPVYVEPAPVVVVPGGYGYGGHGGYGGYRGYRGHGGHWR